MKTQRLFLGVCMAVGVVCVLIQTVTPHRSYAANPAPAPTSLQGIGAIGYIEPRSRILHLSHDAGPEGVRIQVLNVDTGATVKKGDILALFSDNGRKTASRNVAASDIPMLNAKLKAEQANLDYRLRDYQRISQAQSSAISISAKEEAATAVKQSKAEIQSLQSQITTAEANLELRQEELKQSILLSPIDGTIIAVHARPGERVGDDGVVEMADLSKMDVVAEIYERDIARVKIGQSAEITIPGLDGPLVGKVYEIGHTVSKNSLTSTDPLAARDRRIIQVRIALDAKDAPALQHMLLMQVDLRLL